MPKLWKRIKKKAKGVSGYFFQFGEAEEKLFNSYPAESHDDFTIVSLRGAVYDYAFSELEVADVVAGFYFE